MSSGRCKANVRSRTHPPGNNTDTEAQLPEFLFMLDSTERLQARSLLLALAKAISLCLNPEFEVSIVRGGCASSRLDHKHEISIVWRLHWQPA